MRANLTRDPFRSNLGQTTRTNCGIRKATIASARGSLQKRSSASPNQEANLFMAGPSMGGRTTSYSHRGLSPQLLLWASTRLMRLSRIISQALVAILPPKCSALDPIAGICCTVRHRDQLQPTWTCLCHERRVP